jgi:streptogramin lyase
VWVAQSGFGVDTVIDRIDPSTNRVEATIRDPSLELAVVTTGVGAAWATGFDGRLLRIDPKTNELRLVANMGINVGGIIVADGSLWVASRGGAVLRIDPETRTVEASAPGGGSRPAAGPGGAFEGLDDVGMSFGDGIVWLTGKRDGTLDRILVGGNTALDPINVGRTPTAVAVGYGSVWVTVDAEGTA